MNFESQAIRVDTTPAHSENTKAKAPAMSIWGRRRREISRKKRDATDNLKKDTTWRTSFNRG